MPGRNIKQTVILMPRRNIKHLERWPYSCQVEISHIINIWRDGMIISHMDRWSYPCQVTKSNILIWHYLCQVETSNIWMDSGTLPGRNIKHVDRWRKINYINLAVLLQGGNIKHLGRWRYSRQVEILNTRTDGVFMPGRNIKHVDTWRYFWRVKHQTFG
jgi:hypothetical protein